MFPSSLLLFLALTSSSLSTPFARQADPALPVTIVNNCPNYATTVWKGMEQIGVLQPGETLDVIHDTRGFFYQGEGPEVNFDVTMRVGITGNDYYYAVKAPNMSGATVGVTVEPTNRQPEQGFCIKAGCDLDVCGQDYPETLAYDSPPFRFPLIPSDEIPPDVPLYRCVGASAAEGHTITFCPDGYPVEGV